MDRGQARRLFPPGPLDHSSQRSAEPRPRARAGAPASRAPKEEAGRGWTPSSPAAPRPPGEPAHHRRRRARGARRAAAWRHHLGACEVAQRRRSDTAGKCRMRMRPARPVRAASPHGRRALATLTPWTSPGPREPPPRAGRGRPVRRPRDDREVPRRAAAFRHIAANERRHADIWAARLREQGATVPPRSGRGPASATSPPRRLFGTKSVAELVKSLEGDEGRLRAGRSRRVPAIAADEREHAVICARLEGILVRRGATPARRERRTMPAPRPCRRGPAAVPPRRGPAPRPTARREGWHRSALSGTLRAVIFGASDGLRSNLVAGDGRRGPAPLVGSSARRASPA